MKQLIRPGLLFFVSTLILSGCLSPITLNRAVIVYDEAVTRAESEQLLINIARAQHHQPVHFTRVPSIAATFDFRINAGGTPALTGDAGGLLMPLFGGSVAENPTFTIVPIEGEEFTKRLLTPFHQSKLTLLLRQHFDVDLLLRMMAQQVHLQHHNSNDAVDSARDENEHRFRFKRGRHHNTSRYAIELTPEQEHRVRLRSQRHRRQVIYHNSPSDQTGYEMFRRVVLHLSAIQDQKQLYAEPLTFERSWTIPADSVSAEGFQALEKEFTVHYNPSDNTYTLSKQIMGPILITNYDPDTVCCEERAQLHDLTSPWITNDVAFDIRPGYAGGDWPIQGSFRLRSFHSILNFLGHALGEESEYSVEKDPRTPPIDRNENPIMTLDLKVSDASPADAGLSVQSHGKYYSVNTAGPYSHWNHNAFQLLYILFRMTITDAPSLGVPSITIAK
ncbi:hypothetical protein [Nitrosomonas sp.]|uniref:hypothetical protein n=1 Tax=Nitrosomonas sp. TaxID=42353 RepID=UPI0020880824|nr:hypothetical protein [Nitrosomonas sp.]GJL76269.1 MAG: hypothetical protein NMNS02_23750 [Nitrosomonas sp.]